MNAIEKVWWITLSVKLHSFSDFLIDEDLEDSPTSYLESCAVDRPALMQYIIVISLKHVCQCPQFFPRKIGDTELVKVMND